MTTTTQRQLNLDVLNRVILPLFDTNHTTQIRNLPARPVPNQLVSTGLNQFELHVNLTDVYDNSSQVHEIPVPGNRHKKFNVPIAYHEIVFSKKGFYGGDIDIQIKSLKHHDYLRVNSFDLITCICPDDDDLSQQTQPSNNILQNTFTHINGDSIPIPNLNQNHLWYRLNGLGLPKMDGTRGSLYLYIGHREDNHLLMQVLNYHQNSNVDVQQQDEVNLVDQMIKDMDTVDHPVEKEETKEIKDTTKETETETETETKTETTKTETKVIESISITSENDD